MAAVSLQSLLAQDQQTLDGTAVVEGLFTLAPPNQQQVPDDDSAPAVGVSVSLKVEQHEAVPAVASGTSPILAGGGGKKVCTASVSGTSPILAGGRGKKVCITSASCSSPILASGGGKKVFITSASCTSPILAGGGGKKVRTTSVSGTSPILAGGGGKKVCTTSASCTSPILAGGGRRKYAQLALVAPHQYWRVEGGEGTYSSCFGALIMARVFINFYCFCKTFAIVLTNLGTVKRCN